MQKDWLDAEEGALCRIWEDADGVWFAIVRINRSARKIEDRVTIGPRRRIAVADDPVARKLAQDAIFGRRDDEWR